MNIIQRIIASERERRAKSRRETALLIEGQSIVESKGILRRMGREVPAEWDVRLDEIMTSLRKGDF